MSNKLTNYTWRIPLTNLFSTQEYPDDLDDAYTTTEVIYLSAEFNKSYKDYKQDQSVEHVHYHFSLALFQ